jgi:hypothetical protein
MEDVKMSFRTVSRAKMQRIIPGNVFIANNKSMEKILREAAWKKKKPEKRRN